MFKQPYTVLWHYGRLKVSVVHAARKRQSVSSTTCLCAKFRQNLEVTYVVEINLQHPTPLKKAYWIARFCSFGTQNNDMNLNMYPKIVE